MNHNHDHVIRTQEEADAFIHDLLSAIGGLQARVRSLASLLSDFVIGKGDPKAVERVMRTIHAFHCSVTSTEDGVRVFRLSTIFMGCVIGSKKGKKRL